MNGVKIDLKSMRFSYMKFYAQYSEVLFNEPKDFLHPSNKEDEEGGGRLAKAIPWAPIGKVRNMTLFSALSNKIH